MGGTTAKTCVIEGGKPSVSNNIEVARVHRFKRGSGLPIVIPVLDLIEIGSGGGSIAWVDTGGVLKVGPESAGADPGPACYGVGDDATVTDANVVLGYIDPKFFLGGEMHLDKKRAHEVIQRKVAEPTGMSVEQAAAGIVRIANANMIRAIKRVSIERGHDVRDFSLIPFGGAGGLHAGQLMEELGMRRAIVPFLLGSRQKTGDILKSYNRNIKSITETAVIKRIVS